MAAIETSNCRSFVDFLKEEYNLSWDDYVKLGDSTEQADIDKIEEILDSYDKEIENN